jgi:RHS repeat-associated protein
VINPYDEAMQAAQAHFSRPALQEGLTALVRFKAMQVGTAITSYSYDALGQRTRKHSGTAASTTIFAYDQEGQLLGEYSATGAALREFIWFNNEPIAVFTPAATTPATNPPQVLHIHSDHLGTPRVITNQASQSRWSWMAEPFGTTAANNNPASLGAFTFNLRMPGQYADSETGLFYNYFRDLDTATGRYVQSDPIGLVGGINTYGYVGGNPASWIDPLGLYTEVIRWAPSPGLGGLWGHISGNINGENFSFGPKGWDSTYPTAQLYIDRQRSPDINREGAGIVLKLSPDEEAKLARCLKGSSGYNGFSNNCGNPWLTCLGELKIAFPGNRPQVLPEDVLKIIGDSPRANGNTSYPGAVPMYGYPKKP